MLQVPDGSIYFWMYNEGLKHTPIEEIQEACAAAHVDIRPKDMQNWVNGWMRSDRTTGVKPSGNPAFVKGKNYFNTELYEYPENPSMAIGERTDCWVPCSSQNKPLIKWSQGCMSKEDAISYYGSCYLGENMKDLHHIVIDCDGDHNGLHLDTIRFLAKYRDKTHCLNKPKMLTDYPEYYSTVMNEGGYQEDEFFLPASFHLTFMTDRWIPTMHFPNAHIDIVGNRNNSLRYWKNKWWNKLSPLQLTPEIWNDIRDFIGRKENGE